MKKVAGVLLLILLTLVGINQSTFAQDEETIFIEECPIGVIFDEIQLADGCLERRFYQAGAIDGCQISEPVLNCPSELEQALACNPETGWTSVAAGCDSEGYFYEVRYNLCTDLIEPYFNPRQIPGVCPQKVTDPCQNDDQFNDFVGCLQTECGVAIYACDSDSTKRREYEDGSDHCFQAQFNRACAEAEEEEEQIASPVTSPAQPAVTTPPSPTSPSPQPLPSPLASVNLTAQLKGKPVNLASLVLEEGQPLTLTAQTPNHALSDTLCQWQLDNLVKASGQPLTVETSCNLTETFHSDSLNQGTVQVAVTILDKISRQVLASKAIKFKVKDPYPKSSCLLGEDPQIIKQCLIKQAKLEKEPKSGQPLSEMMLCLLDLEGVPSLLGSQPATTGGLLEQVNLAKQAILRGETAGWAAYPLCLNR